MLRYVISTVLYISLLHEPQQLYCKCFTTAGASTGAGGGGLRSFRSDTAAMRRPAKRRSLFVGAPPLPSGGDGGGGGDSLGEAPGGFNVWKEKTAGISVQGVCVCVFVCVFVCVCVCVCERVIPV